MKHRFSKNQTLKWLVFLLVVGLGLVVRLVDLNDPPLDFHPVRQLRSANLARALYFAQDARTDPVLRQQAIGVQPVDVHEPPINEQLAAVVYMVLGGEQVWVGRVLSILYWLIGGMALLAIGRRFAPFWAVVVGLLFYLALPFGVIASRAFMPDPGMVMWILLTVWSVLRWSEKPTWKRALWAGGLAGFGILWKVVAGFFIAGVLVLTVISSLGWRRWWRSAQVWAMAALALVPAVFYYLVLHSGRASEYFTYNTIEMLGMLRTSKFYAQWLAMADGLVGLTVVLVGLLGVTLAVKPFKAVLGGLWMGYIAYGLAWPFQYTTHEYYHLSLVAITGLSIIPVVDAGLRKLNEQHWVWRAMAVGVIAAAAGYQLWVARSMLVATNFSSEPRSWQKVGEALPFNHSFLALTNDYGVRLEYYGMRKAGFYWPGSADLEVGQMRGQSQADGVAAFKDATQGYDYFLVTAMGELDKQPALKQILTNYFPVYHQGAGFVIYDLTRPLQELK